MVGYAGQLVRWGGSELAIGEGSILRCPRTPGPKKSPSSSTPLYRQTCSACEMASSKRVFARQPDGLLYKIFSGSIRQWSRRPPTFPNDADAEPPTCAAARPAEIASGDS